MEFHESLQRDLVKKQNLIAKMKDELVVLRGPVSYDFIHIGSRWSMISKMQNDSYSGYKLLFVLIRFSVFIHLSYAE